MALIDTLIQDVQQKVRKAPRSTIVNAYRRAAREFCQKSLWLRWAQPGSIQANKQVYNLGTDPQLEIIAIPNWRITMPGTAPNVVAGYITSASYFNPNISNGPPINISYVPEGQFACSPIPDASYNVVLTLVVQPTRTSNQIPDVLLRKWDRGIEAGALAYLYDLKGEPWYDQLESERQEAVFRASWNEAKVNAEKGYNTGPSRLRGAKFIY